MCYMEPSCLPQVTWSKGFTKLQPRHTTSIKVHFVRLWASRSLTKCHLNYEELEARYKR